MILNRYGRLAPLLIGLATRQALSRTAQVQAALSRPDSGCTSCCPAVPDPLPLAA